MGVVYHSDYVLQLAKFHNTKSRFKVQKLRMCLLPDKWMSNVGKFSRERECYIYLAKSKVFRHSFSASRWFQKSPCRSHHRTGDAWGSMPPQTPLHCGSFKTWLHRTFLASCSPAKACQNMWNMFSAVHISITCLQYAGLM